MVIPLTPARTKMCRSMLRYSQPESLSVSNIKTKINMKFHINIGFIRQWLLPTLAFALIFSFTACQEKELDLSPVTSISDQDAYSTSKKIEAQVNGLYTRLSSAIFYGGRAIIFNEQRGNEFSQNDGN